MTTTPSPLKGAQVPKDPLKARGEVDAVVLGDVVDGLRGEFTGEGADTHRSENGVACGEVTPEGAA